ncbi:MAG: methyltransferase domain-containing protein [Desulfobacterales bacterium]|nr:methyltransferase domain-containing protein [Desulfobacterales bacterium]
MIRRFRRLRILKRKLRSLQRKYYAATSRETRAFVTEYVRVLGESRNLYLELAADVRRYLPGKPRLVPGEPEICAHFGCEANLIDGWINFDLQLRWRPQVVADLSCSIPLRSGSVGYIHSEDLLEHIDLKGGKRFLRECYRVLRPGGAMRLVTPNLRALVRDLYLNGERKHLAWCEAHGETDGRCEALNFHMRMGGAHRFIYDYELLQRILKNIGFKVRRVSYNASHRPLLRFLDLRNFGLSLFIECYKHG